MITIEKGMTNSVDLTLGERSQLIDPSYVIRFISDDSATDLRVYVPDNSEWQRRFNRFFITEGTYSATFSVEGEVIYGLGSTSSTSIILPYGWGSYEAYEFDPSGTPSFSELILEKGRYFVPGNPVEFQNAIYR